MSQVPYPELQRVVDRFLDEARKYPGVQNLNIDLRLNTPEVRVAINRDKLSDIGVAVDTVGRTLETMLGGRQVTRFKKDGEQYDVIVQVAPVDRATPADISDSYVRAKDGSMVQLSNLVSVKEGVAPQSSITSTGCARSRSPGRCAGMRDRRRTPGDGRRCQARFRPPPRPTSMGNRASSEIGRRIYSRSCWPWRSIPVLAAQFGASGNPFMIMLGTAVDDRRCSCSGWRGTPNIYSRSDW
jgi:hypothetical protein